MGHALDHTLMDALTRRKRMQGYEVLWLPGMDHAGIATQSVVEKQLAVDGKTKEDFGRELFVDKVWDWKHDSGGTIAGADAQARRRRGLEPRPVHHGRRPVACRSHHLQAAVRRRVDLPRRAAGQLVAGARDRDLRPRGQVRGRRGRAGLVPLRIAERRRTAHRGRHHPGRDDARRHRDRGAPRRRALPRPGRQDAAAPVRRPRADHRRRRSTSTPNSARAQSKSRPPTTRTTSRSACGTSCRCRRSWTPRAGSPAPEPNSTAWTVSRPGSRCARRWPSRAASSRRSDRTCTASGTPSAAASRSSRGCRCSGGSRSSRWPRPQATRCATATP